MTNRMAPYPFLKWAGGKGRIIGHVLKHMPKKIKTYYEPFVGGGALFFELARQERFQDAVISDCNEELINAYIVVQTDVEALISELESGNYKYNKTNYLRLRALDTNGMKPVERAARFIYLNRTCFNGLYRVSKQGKFNVPIGSYKNPLICDEKNLRAVSKALTNVRIMRDDFESVVSEATEGDVVYLDPPYVPTSVTSKFTSYNANGFGEADQRRLAECFAKLAKSNVRCVLSNSVAPLVKELYGGYDMVEVTGATTVGGPASYRKPVKEVIVWAGEGPDSVNSDCVAV